MGSNIGDVHGERALDQLGNLIGADPEAEAALARIVGDILGEALPGMGARELLGRMAVASRNSQTCKEIACDALASIIRLDFESGMTKSIDEVSAELGLGRDGDEEALAETVRQVASEMERHILGVEGMENSPVARWACELRDALGAAGR